MKKGVPNSPLGIYLNVDLEIVDTTFNLDPVWAEKLKKNEVSESEIYQAMNMYNNVVMSIKMVLKVVK